MSESLSVNLVETVVDSISVVQDNLFPEGVEFNANTEEFLLSSITEGTIFTTTEDGSISPFAEDERLVSSIGIEIDVERNRLLVANGDVGLSVNSSPETENQLAALGIFDLSTGEPIDYVDLGSLRPGEPHFANDIAVDDEGNVFITDSFSPIIYQVDPEGTPSILLEDEQFAGEGFNLNGIVVHPDNFLIVADSNDGLLFRVPLDNPEQFTQIEIDQTLINADGLLLADEDELIVVTNSINNQPNQVFSLQSNDNFESAEIVEQFNLGDDGFITTATIQDEEILVLQSQLNVLFAGETNDEFEILTVGSIAPPNPTSLVPIIGSSSNDLLLASSNNILVGGNGDDNLFVTQGGNNFLTGGAGADTFQIISGDLPETANTIIDFELGVDVIRIDGLDLSVRSDLNLTQVATDTLISREGREVAILQDIEANTLSESDFIFV